MKGRTDGRTYVRTVDEVLAIKPNFLASMGYQYFLNYGAPLKNNFRLQLSGGRTSTNTNPGRVPIYISIYLSIYI